MEDNSQGPKTTSMWITSLAISIACCAVLFVIFAGYLTEIKKSVSVGNMQLEEMMIQQTKLMVEIQRLHLALNAQPGLLAAPVPQPTAVAPSVSAAPSPVPSAPVMAPVATPVAVPPVPALEAPLKP